MSFYFPFVRFAENIADVMKSVMDEWKIAKPSITIPITTDNA
jgi:hypothetical protein